MSDFQTLRSLPLEQQIGQLLYIGLPGTQLDSDARSLIEYVSPGGVIIFGRNVAAAEQLRALLDGVRASVAVEPLFGIDQEGGLVDRLRKICTPMPAARVIRQPGEVLGYTMVYMRGLQGTGLLGCAKHFPGIGAGEVDTHEEMPVIHLTHDDLIAQDLAPYIELFQREDNMVRAVMISHGGFPNIDIHRGIASGPLVPASINPSIVTDLLRDELGYKGLVLTDDLEMGAIARHYEIEEAALRAVLAGEDMILVCAKPEMIRRAYAALLKAAREGELSSARIESSLRRVAAFKAMTSPPPAFDPKRVQELSMEVAERNRNA